MDEEKTYLKLEGKQKFESARFHGFLAELKALLFNESSELWNFEDIKSKLRLQNLLYRGLQDIPIERIVGSVGRYNDFTREFLPKNQEMQDRWSRVYAQMQGMEGVPPIDVYQVDDVYFVRDGNHRVSIARQLGYDTIQAHVTEIETPIDLEPEMTPAMWKTAEAHSEFLRHTLLDKNRPTKKNPIRLSEPSRYHGLLEHIELTQKVLELEGKTATLEEAAIHWYDNIYVPIVRIIRQYDILQYFPERTEADLYLWLLNNLYHLRQSYAQGDDITAHDFSEAMLDFLRKHKIPIPEEVEPIEEGVTFRDIVDEDKP
jgi:hypothetical protein